MNPYNPMPKQLTKTRISRPLKRLGSGFWRSAKGENHGHNSKPGDVWVKPGSGAHSLHRRVRPHWLDLGEAYDEAANHLDICSGECESLPERHAYQVVAARIRSAGNRLRPNDKVSSGD